MAFEVEQVLTCAGDAVSSVAFLTETLESWRLVDAVGIVVTVILSQLQCLGSLYTAPNTGILVLSTLLLVLVYRCSLYCYQYWCIGTLCTATSTGKSVLSTVLLVLVYQCSLYCYQYWCIGTLYTATSTGVSVLSILLPVLVYRYSLYCS